MFILATNSRLSNNSFQDKKKPNKSHLRLLLALLEVDHFPALAALCRLLVAVLTHREGADAVGAEGGALHHQVVLGVLTKVWHNINS